MKEESKNDNNEINEINPKYKDKELWRVGVICNKDCFYLTEEILKILLKKGYEWKIVSSSYRIKCRKKIDNNDENKIEVNPNNKEEFLVDLHKKSGSVMEFLQFSSSIISSMQQEGFVIFKQMNKIIL